MGIYKQNRPFNHIFGGDRILRAWYRGIKNAGPRKRAQGRAQDIPYQSISPYHHGIWRILIECGKNPHARKSAQGAKRKGSYPTKKQQDFLTTPIYLFGIRLNVHPIWSMILFIWSTPFQWNEKYTRNEFLLPQKIWNDVRWRWTFERRWNLPSGKAG